MGFEFTLALSPIQLASAAGDCQQVCTCFEQTTAIKVYVVEAGLAYRKYAFAFPFRSNWPEDVTIQVNSYGWYLCFHAATTNQIELVIQALTQCLSALGVAGSFEEI
jgi:hypothetical protein